MNDEPRAGKRPAYLPSIVGGLSLLEPREESQVFLTAFVIVNGDKEGRPEVRMVE